MRKLRTSRRKNFRSIFGKSLLLTQVECESCKTSTHKPEPHSSPEPPGPNILPKKWHTDTLNNESPGRRSQMYAAYETTNHAALSAYRKGEFFKALPAEALADFERLLAPSAYPAGIVIFSETQPCDGIYVVLEGEVKLSINSADGRRLSLRIAKAGDVLGLSAAFSGTAYEMTADTIYPAKIAHI